MLLELRSSTPNVMNYGETGIFHFKVIIKERMIKYWSGTILGKEEKDSYIAYDIFKSSLSNNGLEKEWVLYIHKILKTDDYVNWHFIEDFIVNYHVKVIRRDKKIYCFITWYNLVQNSPSCQSLNKHIKLNFETDFYLNRIPESLRVYISKSQTSNHRLPIQKSCYDGTLREERTCTLCNEYLVGDEFHFILDCRNLK